MSRGEGRAPVAIRPAVGDDAAELATLLAHLGYPLHAARTVAQLTALVVPPEMRGRGVGRALVAAAEQWARAQGAERLVVTTALHRADAPLFYERLGFEHTGRRYVKKLDQSE